MFTPPDVLEANANGILLFNKWDASEVEVKDISLTDYIQVRNAVLLPHTAGRYATRQFRKSQMPIVERLVNRSAARPPLLSPDTRARTGTPDLHLRATRRRWMKDSRRGQGDAEGEAVPRRARPRAGTRVGAIERAGPPSRGLRTRETPRRAQGQELWY